MLSQRITALFRLLQCSNSDIARFAGCSPSNISRLKSGLREPRPESRAVLRLAQGVYRYADYENMLPLLRELCGADEAQPDALIPRIISWLYDARDYQPPKRMTPRSRREEARRLQSFGERLDKAMTLLQYSNGRLAADLNVDASLISRYRAGIYHPNRNAQIRDRLTELLLARAERLGSTESLARQCGVEKEALSPETLTEWLYASNENQYTDIAESILLSIDAFAPGYVLPSAPQTPPVQTEERYWGDQGLRKAVTRFLSETAQTGGELLLYSDEPMDWLTGDPAFPALWASLMVACIQRGVQIRIIHNMDRDGTEMISAIGIWLPLYMSGRIEPYTFSKARNPRFHHTVFLRPGQAGILGFFPAHAGEGRWYDYITDPQRLEAMQAGFSDMLGSASPFLKIYKDDQSDDFWRRFRSRCDKTVAILKGLSIATMPDALLDKMLARAEADARQKARCIAFHHASREHFYHMLRAGEVRELLCLPDREAVLSGTVWVNLEAGGDGLRLQYTPAEFAEHISALADIIRNEKNYHVTLLPFAPFRDLQVFTAKDAVAVIRGQEPYTAFAFYNPLLVQSMIYYCNALTRQFSCDRAAALEALFSAGAV